MERGLFIAVSFAFLLFQASSAIAQDVNLGEARRTVLDVASKQVSVLQSLVGKVPPEAQAGISDAIRAQEEGRNKALDALSGAQTGHISKEVGVARAYEAVDQGTRRHLEALRDLVNKVPEQAKPAIERALRESQTGRNKVLSTLSAIKHGQIPPVSAGVERGEGYGPPDRSGKPEGVGIFGGSERKGNPPFGDKAEGFGRSSFPGGGGSGGRPGGFPVGGRPAR